MWVLEYSGEGHHSVNGKSPSEVRLLCQTEYVVGRKDVNILLRDDPSISRKHAILATDFTGEQMSNPLSIPTVSLTDLSKFGTSVNGKTLSGGTHILNDGEEIKFGQMHNMYRAKYTPLVVATSSLPSSDKVKLKECLLQLGGHQVSDWSKECTTLVMGKIGVTVKAVCALANQKPIVTMDYIEQLVKTAKNKTSAPTVDRYIPILANEADKYLLRPNQQRQRVFEGKTFFFCSKAQFDRMKLAVQLAGGTVLLLERKPRTLSKLTTNGAILMYCPTASQPDWYKDCTTYLTRHSKRYIQDAEIGHAVLYCSTELHCNPQQEAGAKLHEEFSQRLSSTQTQNTQLQSSTLTEGVNKRTASKPLPPSNTTIVADSQRSTRSRPADRSAYVADMLPPPAVTLVPETQTRTELSTAQVKVEPQVKRTLDSEPPNPPSKRMKRAVDEPVLVSQNEESFPKLDASHANTQTLGDKSDTQTRGDKSSTQTRGENSNMQTRGEKSSTQARGEKSNMQTRGDRCHTQTDTQYSLQVTVRDDSSTVPSMREVPTPEKSTTTNEVPAELAACHDDSVVEETPPSQASTHNTPQLAVLKTETLDRAGGDNLREEPTHPPTVPRANLHGFSEERKVEIGDLWDRMQVDYGCLLRKTRPPINRANVEERQGMALWKGKWVPNFKRFKKCGKKDITRLPTIIGGGDLVDGLCSQQSQADFVQMPTESQATVRNSRDTITSFAAQPKTTIKSSIFGGRWELPPSKK